MKKVLLFAVIFAVAAIPSFATTKTVGQSGADFTSIQAAIDSFTEAELTDGTPDVVEIIDGVEYDEQVMIGGLIPNPDGLPEGYLDDAIDLALRKDPFTLRGTDPNNRPKINPISEADNYGVFTNDPGDNFMATFAYMGKDITVENVEILQASLLSEDQYGLNGQAGNMVFKNVLFAHSGEAMPGEAIINFNNAADIAGMGINNSYTFIDCTFDATLNGGRNDNIDTIYFHGYSDGEISEAGTTPEDVALNISFEGCEFLNSETVTMIRGNGQANNITVKGCFISGNKRGFRGAGKGSLVIEDSIFYNNMQIGGDADLGIGTIETEERNGSTAALTVRNSLFVENMSADFESLAGIPGIDFQAAAILIRPGGEDPEFTIENCTFVDNPVAVRLIDRSTGLYPRDGSVNNNIFQNCNSSVLTADSASGSYFDSIGADIPIDVLVVNGTNNVFDGNNMIVENAELLPNVSLEGTEMAVTFNNAAIDPDDPFAGPPYGPIGILPGGAGANLGGSTAVRDFMLY